MKLGKFEKVTLIIIASFLKEKGKLNFENMNMAVTITKIERISMDEYKDVYYTKVFDDTATIKEINEWASSIDKKLTLGILSAKLSKVYDVNPTT